MQYYDKTKRNEKIAVLFINFGFFFFEKVSACLEMFANSALRVYFLLILRRYPCAVCSVRAVCFVCEILMQMCRTPAQKTLLLLHRLHNDQNYAEYQ